MPPTGIVSKAGTSRRPAKPTAISRVAADLREAILSAEIEPGAKVNLEQLRARFGVSLSPMREAISRLVTDGLVEFEDQRGYRVAPVSRPNLAELLRLSTELQAIAVSTSALRGDLDWEGQVVAARHRLARAAGEVATGTAEIEQAASALRAALTDGCGLPLLLQFCATLDTRLARYRRMLPAMPADVASAFAAGLARAADAALARQPEAAETAMRGAIGVTGAWLADTLGPRLPPGPPPAR